VAINAELMSVNRSVCVSILDFGPTTGGFSVYGACVRGFNYNWYRNAEIKHSLVRGLAVNTNCCTAAIRRAQRSTAPAQFRIATQPVDRALEEFASQVQLQLVFATDEIVFGTRARAVSGAIFA